MTNPSTNRQVRFDWLDAMKGLAILWIVLFHFCGMNEVFRSYPWILGLSYLDKLAAQAESLSTAQAAVHYLRGSFVAVMEVGFHGVGLFLIASGFGLSYSIAKSGGTTEGWASWYFKRFIRLYPMYWVAHLIYLASPFVYRPEPIDYRIALSMLGVRFYPLDTIFYYANPAWWFFTLLIQLYLAFPVLHYLHRKLGPAGFLALCAALTLGVRYLLLCVTPVHGNVVQGAFFACRLLEFAVGMALGRWARQDPHAMEAGLFRRSTLLAGVALYALGVASYRTIWSYTFTDACTGIGMFILLAHLCRALESYAARLAAGLSFIGTYSYGLYLIHQPYVLYAGEKMEHFGLLAFVAAAVVVTALITVVSVLLEKAVNGGITALLNRKPPNNRAQG